MGSGDAAARDAGIRVVNLRIGVVLSREGGGTGQACSRRSSSASAA